MWASYDAWARATTASMVLTNEAISSGVAFRLIRLASVRGRTDSPNAWPIFAEGSTGVIMGGVSVPLDARTGVDARANSSPSRPPDYRRSCGPRPEIAPDDPLGWVARGR